MKSRLIFPSRRRLKAYAIGLVGLSLAKVLWVCLFQVSGTRSLAGQDRQDLLSRRAYLLHRLHRGDAMPTHLKDQFDGEWALVSHSMTAMALTNLAFLYPESRDSSLEPMEQLVASVLKEEVGTFDRSLWGNQPPLASRHGHIGYLGHLNITLAAYAYLGGQKPEYLKLFAQVSHMLEDRMLASPYLNDQTYPDEIYLADNAVVVASVALYHSWSQTTDRLTGAWCARVDQNYRDAESGILVFRIQPDGRPVPEGRGSGAGWNTFFLFYADQAFAATEFQRLKSGFYVQLPLGLAAIREWPRGHDQPGDVDSGPVILGLSPSGTGFAVAGARFTQDAPMLNGLLRTSEVVGCSLGGSRTHYLTAPLVGESIMLAMRTITPWSRRFLAPPKSQ